MAKSRGCISEEKAKRIAVGATVGGMLLILFLLVILIVQFVQIGVKRSEKERLEQEIEHYSQMIEADQSDLDYYRTEKGLYYLARQEGWK